uniref:(northern house mosquito) hypothetical protein n=1 Tax=Culex pipiens TaxID=7175 RepID=A0A8D8ETS5_CULPI
MLATTLSLPFTHKLTNTPRLHSSVTLPTTQKLTAFCLAFPLLAFWLAQVTHTNTHAHEKKRHQKYSLPPTPWKIMMLFLSLLSISLPFRKETAFQHTKPKLFFCEKATYFTRKVENFIVSTMKAI